MSKTDTVTVEIKADTTHFERELTKAMLVAREFEKAMVKVQAAVRGELCMKPSLGRIVIYRSRTGDYDVPAIINCTTATLNPKGVEAGYVPPLSSDLHVHLTVFTPGQPGLRLGAEDFKAYSPYGRSENVAGCYQEWDIAPAGDFDVAVSAPEPGTWRWPERVW